MGLWAPTASAATLMFNINNQLKQLLTFTIHIVNNSEFYHQQ
jgi:hypothetical protein